MPDRRRPEQRSGRALGLAVGTVALCLLTSCSGQPHAAPAKPSSSRSATTATPAPTATPTPADPTDLDPTVLGDRLEQALATVRSGPAGSPAVQQAAEFQQLAVRRLASSKRSFRRQVVGRLDAATAAIVAAEVRASTVLGRLTTPRPDLPPWRIVAPAPPRELLGDYRAAGRRLGVPWTYLAAINLVETRMGRIRGRSTAGARGPMQFLPATWARFGAGGDINDPRDAIFAAARLLRAYGAPADLPGALWHYNPSRSYVQAVTEYARTMQQAPWTYRGYWHWRVLYRQQSGTYVLPIGFPRVPPVLLDPQ